jgi:hypothetical protein
MTVFLRSLGSVSSLLVATVYQGNHGCFILNVLARNGISVSEHESNLCRFFFLYHLLIYVLPWDIQLSVGEGRDPIYRFNPAVYVHLSQIMTRISNFICHCLACVHWTTVIGYCSFCWYWWNCWLSLFKLSYPN